MCVQERNSGVTLDKMNLSFAGCGFLGIYHVGVASCFREYCPQICMNKISGASAGALVATAMALDLSLGESTSDILKVAIKARSRALGPFHPTFDVNEIITDALMRTLPNDAHEKVNGRLNVSVTRVSDGKNCILSQFDSKEDLIQAVLCSCFIPCWSGLVPPKFHGVAYMDGGFSDNLLKLDEYSVTISPFSGESDICPQDSTFNSLQINLSNTSIALSTGNLYRMTRILFPPHPEIMSKMCEQGFNDALKFLQRNNKISCLRCLAIQSSFLVSDSNEEENEEELMEANKLDCESDSYDDGCIDCKSRREMAIADSLPDPVAQAIREAVDSVNRGLINWLFKHRPVKILSFMTVPYVLPFDITLVLLIKTWKLLPYIRKELKTSLYSLLSFTTKMVNKMQSKKNQCSAKFSCELAITEFDYSNEIKSFKPVVKPFDFESNIRRKSVQSLSRNENIKEAAESTLKHFHDEDLKVYIKKDKIQRNSYAGREFSKTHPLPNLSSNKERRNSMVDLLNCLPSERVIQKMNFDLTFDLPNDNSQTQDSSSTKNLNKRSYNKNNNDFTNTNETDKVFMALKTLGSNVNSENIDLDAVDITNKALSLEKVYFENCSKQGVGKVNENADAIQKIMEVTTNHEALMAFYYLDENKRVKVTEIFNMTDEKPRDNRNSEMFSFNWNCTEEGIVGNNNYNVDREDGLASLSPSQNDKSRTLMKSKLSD